MVLDRVAFVSAFLLPPVGFTLGLIAAARGRAYRGWSSGLARAAVWVSLAMAVVFVIGGSALWMQHQERVELQQAEDEAAAAYAAIAAESAEFCAATAAHPALFASGDPEYGWPQAEDTDSYRSAIADYAATWQGLVAVAPPAVSEQVTSFSTRVNEIAARADTLPEPNRAGDLLDLHAQQDIDAVAQHVTTYCNGAGAEN